MRGLRLGPLASLQVVLELVTLLLATAVIAQTSLDELERSLVFADFEQLDDALLVRLQPGHLADQVAHEFGVLVLLMFEQVLVGLTILSKLRLPIVFPPSRSTMISIVLMLTTG